MKAKLIKEDTYPSSKGNYGDYRGPVMHSINIPQDKKNKPESDFTLEGDWSDDVHLIVLEPDEEVNEIGLEIVQNSESIQLNQQQLRGLCEFITNNLL